MRRFFTLVLLLSQLAFAVESIPLSRLEDMWRAGRYQEVEAYARARLAVNSDDLFGHLLMHNVAYNSYSPDLLDVASDGIKKAWKSQRERFKNLNRFEVNFSENVHDVERMHLRKIVEELSSKELATEKTAVSARRGQNFLNRRFLHAAESDGFNESIFINGIKNAALSSEDNSNNPALVSSPDVKNGGHTSVVRDGHQGVDANVPQSNHSHRAVDSESDTNSTTLIALLVILIVSAVLGLARWIRRKKGGKR